ncbi:MAG: RAMP superfamily CRISPR-associated protein, partial [Ardenticatenaceae bacterium]
MSNEMVRVQLVTGAALHVGSGQADGLTDDLLRRTAAGELFIPGSAIAGPLRAIATRLAPRLGMGTCKALTGGGELCQCQVCALFGEINPQEGNEQGGKASALWAYDAYPAATTGDGATAIRDGVGIERGTGAAASSSAVKFDLEALPAGATFDLRMELRAPGGEVDEASRQ